MAPIIPGSAAQAERGFKPAHRGNPQRQTAVTDTFKILGAAPARPAVAAQAAVPATATTPAQDAVPAQPARAAIPTDVYRRFRYPNMSARARIQNEAQRALEVMGRTAGLATPGRFGPVEQRALATKLAILSRVTADTAEEKAARDKADRAHRRKVERLLRLSTPRVPGEGNHWSNDVEESEDEDGDEDGNEDSEDPADAHPDGERPKNNKRRRSDADGDDDEAPAPKRSRYPIPAVQIQQFVDVAKLVPIQLTYHPHPASERSDAWWVENFRRLYHQVENMVTHYFTLHDISKEDGSPWALGMTPEFVRWAEEVADPDWEARGPMAGWDELLKDSTQRKWLLVGVLTKIFKVKVFDEYLFGASKEQKEACFALDRAFLGREGFQRRIVLSTTVRTVLGANAVTESFYPSVAKLSAQIFLMLQPLTNYLYSLPPPSNKKLPLVADLHQSLHNLVSHAAYLSICVRVSPNIMQFVDLQPGADWDPDDMYSLETEQYTQSKADVIAAFSKNEWEPWRKRAKAAKDLVNLLEHQQQSLEQQPTQAQLTQQAADQAKRDRANAKARADGTPEKQDLSPVRIPEPKRLQDARTALDKVTQEKPDVPSWTHRAQTKISVWPVIRRYRAGSDADDKDHAKPLRERDGFRILLIANGAVVAKYGRKNEPLRVELHDWVKVKTREADYANRRRVQTAVGVLKKTAKAAVVLGAASTALNWQFGSDALQELPLREMFRFYAGAVKEVFVR
ncbi:uncharacterized protein L3040_007731 [Drepanopeziza brunnea f. sp. 'multigermtubi']|uniref:uncharacterized protein n=1 Tax=Drepanopeziza brunnea f. sp. 'multigermtubi' TaxID=698441 RepID=UPI00238F7CA0|nr:hypothetical protein L3040_007731 [Drepanopeziza brunnea f. sp. 'multigermtubi']